MYEPQDPRQKFIDMCIEHLYKKYHKTHKPTGCTRLIDYPRYKLKRFTLTLVNKNNHEFLISCYIDYDSFNKLQNDEDFVFENLFDKKIQYHYDNSC